MKPIQVPSQDSSQNEETLSTFLGNSDFRKLYNRLLEKIKKYRFLESNNWFLKKCLEEKIVPKSFKINNRINNNSKDVTHASGDGKQNKAHKIFQDK